ncbi:unnamed protein product, partial [Vitis vinifera]|uniref:Uncharacterized protein n=1 Tax=Vitis vinifera TaxID=29760 RepID=D7T755_VITVI
MSIVVFTWLVTFLVPGETGGSTLLDRQRGPPREPRSFQIDNELSWCNPGSQWQGRSFLFCSHFWGILLAGVLPNTCRGVIY